MHKLDLGGGTRPKPGFINVDQIKGADVQLDFDGFCNLPYDDDSVDEVYSSHCFEHLKNYSRLLQEVARVCCVGADVEIRVPYWGSDMALVTGHVGNISETQVRHWREFADDWWGPVKKWFTEPLSIEYVPDRWFGEAKGLFPHLSDQQIMRFIQGTCHEIRYKFKVETRP